MALTGMHPISAERRTEEYRGAGAAPLSGTVAANQRRFVRHHADPMWLIVFRSAGDGAWLYSGVTATYASAREQTLVELLELWLAPGPARTRSRA